MDVPAVGTTTTLNLPTVNGTLIASDNSGNVTYTGTTTFSGNATFNAGLVPSSSFLRNRIINGDMRIDQRYGGGSVSVPNATVIYATDRWNVYEDTSGTLSFQRSTIVPTGFTSSLLVSVTSAGTATASQLCRIQQRIEGFNIYDLAYGTPSAATVTVSFWVRSSLIGTYCVGIRNNALDRSYVGTYTISSANTWEQKSITIPGDTSGTWLTDSGVGMYLSWDLGSGSSSNTTAGTWVSGDRNNTSAQANWCGTAGATFYVTGVQFEVGSVATPFERRQYGQEIALCQRYYNVSGFTEYHVVPAPNATYLGVYRIHMPVQMRANPTVGVSYSATNAVLDFGWYTQNFNFMVHYITASVSTNAFMFFVWTASAEL
jgi:hypothetical protein